jgi:hypothetical protein
MLRSILAIILGFLAGSFTVYLIELPGMIIYSPPPGTDMSDSEAMKKHLASLPTVALAGVALAWTMGPLVGAWLAALIARRAFLAHGLVVGAIFLVMDLIMLSMIPHPIWLAAVGVVAPLLSAWLGATLAARMSGPRPSGPQPYDMREKNMAC